MIGSLIGHAATAGGRAWHPTNLDALAVWIKGDDRGATFDTAPNPDEYLSIPNRGSLGNSFDSGVGTRPSALLVDGKNAPDFLSTERLAYSGAAADLNFIHNTSGEAAITLKTGSLGAGAHTLLSNTVSTPGVWIYRATTTGIQIRIYKSGTTAATLQCQYWTDDDVLTFEKDTSEIRVYVNGELQGTAALDTPTDSDAANALHVGNLHTGGGDAEGAIPEIIVQSTVDHASMHARINWLQKRWGTGPNLFFHGNSLTAGTGSSYAPQKNFTRQMDVSGLGSTMIRRVGIGGAGTPGLTAGISADVMPKYIGDGTDLLFIYEAGNDMLAGATAAQAWDNMAAYYTAARAAGWYGAIATCTIGPRSDVSQTKIDDYNALVRANWASVGFAFLSDFGDDAGLAVPAYDGIHYDDAQYLIVAGYVESDIATWWASV